MCRGLEAAGGLYKDGAGHRAREYVAVGPSTGTGGAIGAGFKE